ncbi:MAG: hypothetical protein IKQ71_10245, partial [Lachnospiraceae bacterium]|nr:hypothetical protein [Lachnospiraceae bacterium]
MKKRYLGRKLLSFLLTLAMLVGLMPGMSLTAYADVSGAGTEAIHTFDAASTGDALDKWEYTFPLENNQKSKITQIDALIDMGSLSDDGWAQVKYGRTQGEAHYVLFDRIPGIKKYTAGTGVIENADHAVVQLVGKGRLLAYTIEFSEGDPATGGNWGIPEATPPAGKMGLKYTGSQQDLVTEGTITSGTGTLEYSIDKNTWSTNVPKATNAGSYTVYYRLKYDNGSKTYNPLAGENGISVSIEQAEVTVTAKDQSIMVGGTVPDLSAPVLNTHYSVTGLVGTDALITAPTLTYQKNDSAATPDSATADTYDIVPSGASAGDNYNISYTKGTLTISEKQPATVTKVPTAKTLTYYGSAQELVTAGTATDGVMQYALGTATEATQPYTTSIPTATNAGTYYIWYKVVGDENHFDSDPACVTSKIRADISKTVTFKVVNGSWNDGETKDKVVKITGFEGDTIKLSADKIPAVGTKPSDGYKEGSWDTVPKADTEIKADTTYTYTYAKKEEVKPEPIVEPAPAEKIKLTVTAKDQTIAFGAAISQASSKYTIKGLQTGDEAKVT